MALLVERGGGELRDAHVARVQTGDEPLDRAALAGRVPALEEDQNGRAQAAVARQAGEPQAQGQQSLLSGREAFGLLVAVELEREVEVVESAHRSILPGGVVLGQAALFLADQ